MQLLRTAILRHWMCKRVCRKLRTTKAVMRKNRHAFSSRPLVSAMMRSLTITKGKENTNRPKNMPGTVDFNHVQHISFTQSRLTDAVSVILNGLLSYEHPPKVRGFCLRFAHAFLRAGSWASTMAQNTRQQPASSRAVRAWRSTSQPASTLNTLSRLRVRLARVGSTCFWATTCRV